MSSLPEPYLGWYRALVGEDPPDEPLATCGDCPLCREGRLLPELKCCGYAPALPNWRAGQALLAGGLAAEHVRRRLAEGRATETWLLPTEAEQARYEAEGQLDATPAGRCPFYTASGTCAIWAHRNGACSTWFCRHGHGERGAELWATAAEVFHLLEGCVAVWAAGDGYEAAARRVQSLDWDTLRRLGGRDLAEVAEVLRARHRALTAP